MSITSTNLLRHSNEKMNFPCNLINKGKEGEVRSTSGTISWRSSISCKSILAAFSDVILLFSVRPLADSKLESVAAAVKRLLDCTSHWGLGGSGSTVRCPSKRYPNQKINKTFKQNNKSKSRWNLFVKAKQQCYLTSISPIFCCFRSFRQILYMVQLLPSTSNATLQVLLLRRISHHGFSLLKKP